MISFPSLKFHKKLANFLHFSGQWSLLKKTESWVWCNIAETYLELYQTSKMDIFVKKASSLKLERVLNTSLHLKLDILYKTTERLLENLSTLCCVS